MTYVTLFCFRCGRWALNARRIHTTALVLGARTSVFSVIVWQVFQRNQ
jgi:hypothetical protein